MELSIGSYKLRLEICILIVVIGWIMFGHLLCSCSRVSMQEGFETAKLVTDAMTGSINKNNSQNKTINNVIEKMSNIKLPTNKKEGFSNSVSAGFSFSDSKAETYYQDPSKWNAPALSFGSGGTSSSDVLNRPNQPIPLPSGEMSLFATTEFKPECCPNAYSTSSGCACMTVDQYKYLKNRGSNNVPFSEY